MKELIVVESPVKVSKIVSFLKKGGIENNYIVSTSKGHIMDLDPLKMSIDLNTFKPTYKVLPKATNTVETLKKLYSKVDGLIIASDLDREGEFIGESLRTVLKVKDDYKRIVFIELTKTAILNALNNPTKLNHNVLMAQQTRRFIDRIYGYSTTPLLKRIKDVNTNDIKGLGCGRVQNIIVKIIIDREMEIENFYNDKNNDKMFYTCSGKFLIDNNIELDTTLYFLNKPFNSIFPTNILIDIMGSMFHNTWEISKIISRTISTGPKPPFTTSSLQCEASTKLKWSIKKTMQIAQELYETGYITYIRTDSTILSNDALSAIKNYILDKYGEEYYSFTQYDSSSQVTQDAHEAIRPTDINNNISELSDSCRSLYLLIFNRTIASQMSKCITQSQQIIIKPTINYKTVFSMRGSKSYIEFPGYTIIYNNASDNENIMFSEDMSVRRISIMFLEKRKNPVKRYSEADIIKIITKNGIGRPSTFEKSVTKIIEKGYVSVIDEIEGKEFNTLNIGIDKDNNIICDKCKIKIGNEHKKLIPNKIAFIVNDFLEKNFSQMMDVNFTKQLENDLDLISMGKLDWYNVIKNFYTILKFQIDNVIKIYNYIPNSDKNDNIIGTFNDEPIYYIKKRNGLMFIKWNSIWIKLSDNKIPDKDKCIEMINSKNQVITEVIKTLDNDKYIVKRRFDKTSEKESFFIQHKARTQMKFKPILKKDIEKLTIKDCKLLFKN